MTRGRCRVAALLAAVVVLLLTGALPASAHPLGNFTVNSYVGLRVEPRAVAVDVVVDFAEIPTVQLFPSSQQGVAPEDAEAYRERECAAVARGTRLAVDGQQVPVRVERSALEFPPGNAGLPTTRLTCLLRSASVDTVGSTVSYVDEHSGARVGWREVTAVGDGVVLEGSDVPEQSVSRRLTAYPEDLLSSPLDQRAARMSVRAGSGVVSGWGPEQSGTRPADTPSARGADRITAAYTDLISSRKLDLGFGLLAVALAVLLGAMHAFAPGHGKTLMAAYLVSRNGSLRQAAVIGFSVTVTHTLGVLVLGIALTVVTAFAPERVYPWLGLASGLLLAGIGAGLLRSALAARAQRRLAAPVALAPAGVVIDHDHDHDHDQHGHDQHGHDHGHHDHDHGHSASERHSHGLFSHTHAPAGASTRSLLAVGLAGGLVPSPSALLVLLGGIALGRAWLGVLLVLAYGIGMALALVATGMLLVRARAQLERWTSRRGARVLPLARALPIVTAGVVLVLGLGVAWRGLLAI